MSGSVLVTGAAGFAGSHLVDLLRGTQRPIVAWRRPGGRWRAPADSQHPRRTARPGAGIIWQDVDLTELEQVRRALETVQPSLVFHCAGAAHVGSAWRDTGATFTANVLGTHHLLEGLRRSRLEPRILLPGSAMIYRPSDAPIDENHPLGPVSPYGASKLAQELLGRQAWADEGQAVLPARSFNHTGPRQAPVFAASAFARQIARIEQGVAEPVLHVGNLDARRDLTDVRDTVRAYVLIAERGVPGRPYNVCSGTAPAIGDVLDGLLALARTRARVERDPALLRPGDTPLVVGNPGRIRDELGWKPAIPLDRTLADLLDYWRQTRD